MSSVSRTAIDLALDDLRRRSRNEVYFDNPALWAEEVLGVELWSKQREILDSLVNNKRTAIRSCHSASKSFTMGLAACWWVATRGSDSLVVSTAPGYAQVHTILWAEIRKHWTSHTLPGLVTQDDRWSLSNRQRTDGKESMEVVAFGRRPADQDASAFQGLHRTNGVLFIIDESCGVPEMIMTAAEVNTTSANCRILAVGNPDDIQTPFGQIFKRDDSTWNKIKISAFDTPNFTGEKISPKLAMLLPQVQWVEDMKIQWGEDSSRYKSKILAEFPDQSDFMFFTQAELDTSTDFDPNAKRELDLERPVVGADIGRMGEDSSSAYGYQGFEVKQLGKWGKCDLVETAAKLKDICRRIDAAELRIDATGIGAGVVDILVNDADFPHSRCAIYPMYGTGAAKDPFVHANARAERHDEVKTLIRSGKLKIDPEDKQLLNEMLSVRHSLNKRGAIQIESKEDMRKRGAKSPDCFDAVTYAVCDIEWVKGPQPGDTFVADPEEYAGGEYGSPEFDALEW